MAILIKRRWKIVASILVVTLFLILLIHFYLSSPSSLPLEQGEQIHVGTSTFLWVFTFPNISASHYTIEFKLPAYSYETLVGEWQSSSAGTVFVSSQPFSSLTHVPSLSTNGSLNLILRPDGNYFLIFFSSRFTTFTVTRTIQLIPGETRI